MSNILTIAGSDTLGGGGLQADLKTFEAFGHFGVSAVTCLATVMPDQTFQIQNIETETVLAQIEAILHYVPLTTIKIGLINDATTLEKIGHLLQKQPHLQIITDPVLAFKETTDKLQQQYLDSLKEFLLPQSLVVTPNLVEAQLLSGLPQIQTRAELEQAATIIQSIGPQHVVIKGGQRFPDDDAIDLLRSGTTNHYLSAPRLTSATRNGAGCTLSAAITAEIASGHAVYPAVKAAKQFVYHGIQNGIQLRHGFGNVRQGGSYEF